MNQQIRDVQQALTDAGFTPGAVDGQAGPQTWNAIHKYVESIGAIPPRKPFTLTTLSLERLRGVHSDLTAVVENAPKYSDVEFQVGEGMRTAVRQRQLFQKGASKTMNSRHLTGHAVDLIAYEDGVVSWRWPLYHKIADAMKLSASELGTPIEAGADWVNFPDGPHFQLPRQEYPAQAT